MPFRWLLYDGRELLFRLRPSCPGRPVIAVCAISNNQVAVSPGLR
jgi:hypothetical protein